MRLEDKVGDIRRVVELDGGLVRIKLFRNLATENAEFCEYTMELKDNGTCFASIGPNFGLKHFFYNWQPYNCPECDGSDWPGRIYNNNDTTSGQFIVCPACNEDGDTSPGCPDYDPSDFTTRRPLDFI